MLEIKYIGFYDLPVDSNERACTLSATNKMDYISDVIVKSGFNVHIVSPSWAVDEIAHKSNLKYKNIALNKNKKLTLFPSLKIGYPFFKPIKIIFSLIYLLFWLIFNVKKHEKILVYHEPLLSFPLLIAKRIKKFIIILEVEEIYTEVWEKNLFLKKSEWNLIQEAESYMCASDLLSKRLGANRSIVVYGSYKIPENNTKIINKSGVNMVYAGSLDRIKGGVFKSIETLEFMDNNYNLHICGYGSKEQISEVVNLIEKMNQQLKREACIFHGRLIGTNFTNLLYSCDIGLNPQNQGEYMMTAFPSKILTYLSHNLNIVSSNIESITASAVAEYIYFSRNDSAKEISNTIKSIDLEKCINNTKIIMNLEYRLIDDISKIFE